MLQMPIANLAARMRCVMLIRTLYFEQASIIAAVLCSLIVAGFLKGIIGVSMPVVALPLLSLFIDIKSAAMLLRSPLSQGIAITVRSEPHRRATVTIWQGRVRPAVFG
jgi:hypothetical protein